MISCGCRDSECEGPACCFRAPVRFNCDPRAQLLTARRRRLEETQLRLQRLVITHGHRPSAARSGLRAFRSEAAGPAGFRIESHHRAGFESFDFAGRAGDCAAADINLEISFSEKNGLAFGTPPRLAEYFASILDDSLSEVAIQKGSVDVQLIWSESEPGHCRLSSGMGSIEPSRLKRTRAPPSAAKPSSFSEP